MTLLQPHLTTTTTAETRTVGQRYRSVFLMAIISLLLLGGLGGRLMFLQLIEGDRNRQLAEKNRIRLIPKLAERGVIRDRKGRILAGSRLSHSVFLWPLARKKGEWSTTVKRLAHILNLPERVILKRLEQAGYNSPFLVRIARGITPAQVTAISEYAGDLEGVQVDAEAVRYYPNGDLAAHVLGYTGELTDEELERRKGDGYRLGDVVGQMGIELAFENLLRGERGGQQVEVDGAGQVVRILGQKPTKAGQDVTLTLDLDLQKAAEKALGDRKGAVVAIDPNNGAVLAMVSRPAFDPNLFSTRISDAQWRQLQSADHPFVNRAIQAFQPASTYKIVTTVAALESGKYTPDTVLPTYPSLTIGGIVFNDWNRAGFGPLDFPGAMAYSSDTFFYQVAMTIGDRTLIDWTRRFGFGRKTGIELGVEESPGLVPDDAWKREELKEGWYLGDTVNMSIGQGFLLTTPLQVAVMFAVPSNGGYLVKPHLLKDNEESKSWRESLNLKPTTVEKLHRGLRDVVTYGTGGGVQDDTLPAVAGKSGTSEDMGDGSDTWFGAYAPFDKPEIIVIAFAERSGGGGGSVGAPIVRQVLHAYFSSKKKPRKTQ
ncbi:MAG: penicillin-binding protein 2 [Leptolyngbyaceae cyanobacterium bins.349]|nr:penicillin-binding protein 2 [Leptolyngbyaceae cyanobacterium bins.349]